MNAGLAKIERVLILVSKRRGLLDQLVNMSFVLDSLKQMTIRKKFVKDRRTSVSVNLLQRKASLRWFDRAHVCNSV